MPIFQDTSFQQIKEGSIQVVQYAATFFCPFNTSIEAVAKYV